MTVPYLPDPPIWCAGCGHFGVQGAIAGALGELCVADSDVIVLAGIVCS